MVSFGRAIARGFDEVTTAGGARALAALLVVLGTAQLLVNTFLDGLVVSVLRFEATLSYVATLPIGPDAAAWLLVPVWILGSWLLAVVVRVAADDRSVLAPEHATREALPATVRLMVFVAGGGALVVGGLAFGLAPGVLLFGHLLFVPYYVAVEDDGLVDAVVRSWRLVATYRVRALLFATGVVATALAVAAGSTLVTLGSPLLEFVVGVVLLGLGVVVVTAATVDIRRQHDEAGVGVGATPGGHGTGAL